ncbi:hypothetical protein [Pseudomonas syringae]|uniref:hypothetical protein n=1 Tax=Pseudomonas syringae TaxID=317 RepID=UPI0015C444B1|nr:hypothetical protein [Pseudomonas syringae]
MAACWQHVRFNVGSVAADVLRLLGTKPTMTTTANGKDGQGHLGLRQLLVLRN